MIAIDVQGEQASAVSRLQEAQVKFGEVDFDVTGNQTYRIVTHKWNLKSCDSLDEEILDEIAESFAMLVRLGHQAVASDITVGK